MLIHWQILFLILNFEQEFFVQKLILWTDYQGLMKIVKKLPDAKHQVFAFWTGNNAMSDNRKDCLRTLQTRLEVPLVLVRPKNLEEYIVTDHPLPSEFHLLSNVHKSDYLRSYFMYY